MRAALIVANVIFPAPSFPYMLTFFMPVAVVGAMAIEVAIFRGFQKKVSFSALLALVLGANLFSWFGGMLLTGILPSGLVQLGEPGKTYVTQGPDYDAYAYLGFGFACAASIVLELVFLAALKRRFRLALERLALCVSVANLGSYAMLLVWVTVYWRI